MLSDLFSELSLVQWVFIGLGLLLVLPSVVGFFNNFKDKIIPDSKPHNPTPKLTMKKLHKPIPPDDGGKTL